METRQELKDQLARQENLMLAWAPKMYVQERKIEVLESETEILRSDRNRTIAKLQSQYRELFEKFSEFKGEIKELKGELAIADQMVAELQQAKFDSMPIVSRDIHEEKYGLIRRPRTGSHVTLNNYKCVNEDCHNV